MNKIEYGMKLDFGNVLIRPKRTTISSRSEVDLERNFNFNSKNNWKGTPVIAANMDTIGTFEIYDKLKEFKIMTALHKHYDLDDFLERNKTNPLDPNFFMVSTGIGNSDFDKLNEILQNIDCKWICIDVANGYMNKLVEFCRKVRDLYPDKIIVAGNVVTREMVEELILNGGVNIVKVGIGS